MMKIRVLSVLLSLGATAAFAQDAPVRTFNKWPGAYSINVPDMHEADDTGAAELLK